MLSGPGKNVVGLVRSTRSVTTLVTTTSIFFLIVN
jgi:hypothetical protein